MTARNLEFLFRPKSVAVIAEPNEPSHYAEVVLRNLVAGRFPEPIVSATARKRSRLGIGGRVRIDGLTTVPDLAIVCAALDNVPEIINKLGALGTRAVIVGPSSRSKGKTRPLQEVRRAILDAARPHLIRVLGPGSGGLFIPARGLNASVAPFTTRHGKIALITQSASIASAVLDRASRMGIGFSSVLHLGASIDIDLADALDWFAEDPDTESILVQFDSVLVGRKFMSAARAAARNKPVVALHGGRFQALRATNGPFTTNDLYDAALRRAGWVCVDTLSDLFEAAEALARQRPLRGNRLSILANGYGLGRFAGDALLRAGGQLSPLSKETVKHLDAILHFNSMQSNPFVLPANITPEKWAAVLAVVLKDSNVDAVLTVCSPSPFGPSTDVASALCKVALASERNVLTCWVGGTEMLEAQKIAAAHGVLNHDSPEKGVAVFLGIVNYLRNRKLLMQMPPSRAEDFTPDINVAQSIVSEAIRQGEASLSADASRRLLCAYGIKVAEYRLAGSVEVALLAASEIGYPVDLGLVLTDVVDFEPVESGLRSPADIHAAVRSLRRSARDQHSGCRVSGYRLAPSGARSGTPALRLGVVEDSVFGPVIYLGLSASAKTRQDDFAIALPPLNQILAQDLVERSHFSEVAPGSQREALEAATRQALVRLSQMLTDLDEVSAVELDPLHVESDGVLVLNASIRIKEMGCRQSLRRFAICPYPKHLEQNLDWAGRKLLIRPIRPEDETTLSDLLSSLSPEDARMRFFDTMRRLPRSQLARFTQIDYDREMALVAIERDGNGVERSLGEVRVVASPDNVFADFAIVVSSGIKGNGLGRLLMQSIITYARSCGIGELRGETLIGNLRMQRLAQSLGFTLSTGAERGSFNLRLSLRDESPS